MSRNKYEYVDEILKKIISECPGRPDEMIVRINMETDDMEVVSYEITDITNMGSNDSIVITIKEI